MRPEENAYLRLSQPHGLEREETGTCNVGSA